MSPEPIVLLDKWTRWTRWFFLLFGCVLGSIAVVLLSSGSGWAAALLGTTGAGVVSLFWLENRTLLDPGPRELVLRFRWTFHRAERRLPLASVTAVYLRPLGKGGTEMGLKLTQDTELSLGQLMGSEDDREALAARIAGRIGVPVVRHRQSDTP